MKPDVVSIVACGPSALACGAAHAPGYVIAVNGAADHVRHDAVLTMDGRFARNRVHDLVGRQFFVRATAATHINRDNPGFKAWKGFTVFSCNWQTTKFAERVDYPGDIWQLNGSNSGYCALNLAYCLRPKLIWLYGFDMDEPTHFFGDYPWKSHAASNTRGKFKIWADEMKDAACQFMHAGIVIYNTNKRSAITAFQKVSVR